MQHLALRRLADEFMASRLNHFGGLFDDLPLGRGSRSVASYLIDERMCFIEEIGTAPIGAVWSISLDLMLPLCSADCRLAPVWLPLYTRIAYKKRSG